MLLEIVSPTRGSVLGTKITDVKGTLHADVFDVAVNGEPAEISGEKFLVSALALREGSNSLRATGKTSDGDAVTDSATIFADWTPPKISIRDFPEGSVCSYLFDPKDVVIEDLTPLSHTVTVDGAEVTELLRSRTPGTYQIDVNALDRAGNESSKSFVVNISADADCLEAQSLGKYFDGSEARVTQFLDDFLDALADPDRPRSRVLLDWFVHLPDRKDLAGSMQTLWEQVQSNSVDNVMAFWVAGPSAVDPAFQELDSLWQETLQGILSRDDLRHWVNLSVSAFGGSPAPSRTLHAMVQATEDPVVWRHFAAAVPQGYFEELTELGAYTSWMGLLSPTLDTFAGAARKGRADQLADALGRFLRQGRTAELLQWSSSTDRRGHVRMIGHLLANTNFQTGVYPVLASLDPNELASIARQVRAVVEGEGSSRGPLQGFYALAGEAHRRMVAKGRKAGEAGRALAPFLSFAADCLDEDCAKPADDEPSALEEMLHSLDHGNRPVKCLKGLFQWTDSASEIFLKRLATLPLEEAWGGWQASVMQNFCDVSEAEAERWGKLAAFAQRHESEFQPFQQVIRAMYGDGSASSNLLPEFLRVNHVLLEANVYGAMRPLLAAAAATGLMDEYLGLLGTEPDGSDTLAEIAAFVVAEGSDGKVFATEFVRTIREMHRSGGSAFEDLFQHLAIVIKDRPERMQSFARKLNAFLEQPTFVDASGLWIDRWLAHLGRSFPETIASPEWGRWMAYTVEKGWVEPWFALLEKSLSHPNGKALASVWHQSLQGGESGALYRIASALHRSSKREELTAEIIDLSRRWSETEDENEAQLLRQMARDGMLARVFTYLFQMLSTPTPSPSGPFTSIQ